MISGGNKPPSAYKVLNSKSEVQESDAVNYMRTEAYKSAASYLLLGKLSKTLFSCVGVITVLIVFTVGVVHVGGILLEPQGGANEQLQ